MRFDRSGTEKSIFAKRIQFPLNSPHDLSFEINRTINDQLMFQ